MEQSNILPRDFKRFDQMLCADGWLGIQTGMLESDEDFPDWWYIRDPTHICFCKRETMDWIANHFSWDVEYPGKNITLFHKVGRSA